jgi:hypothetical protein
MIAAYRGKNSYHTLAPEKDLTSYCLPRGSPADSDYRCTKDLCHGMCNSDPIHNPHWNAQGMQCNQEKVSLLFKTKDDPYWTSESMSMPYQRMSNPKYNPQWFRNAANPSTGYGVYIVGQMRNSFSMSAIVTKGSKKWWSLKLREVLLEYSSRDDSLLDLVEFFTTMSNFEPVEFTEAPKCIYGSIHIMETAFDVHLGANMARNGWLGQYFNVPSNWQPQNLDQGLWMVNRHDPAFYQAESTPTYEYQLKYISLERTEGVFEDAGKKEKKDGQSSINTTRQDRSGNSRATNSELTFLPRFTFATPWWKQMYSFNSQDAISNSLWFAPYPSFTNPPHSSCRDQEEVSPCCIPLKDTSLGKCPEAILNLVTQIDPPCGSSWDAQCISEAVTYGLVVCAAGSREVPYGYHYPNTFDCDLLQCNCNAYSSANEVSLSNDDFLFIQQFPFWNGYTPGSRLCYDPCCLNPPHCTAAVFAADVDVHTRYSRTTFINIPKELQPFDIRFQQNPWLFTSYDNVDFNWNLAYTLMFNCCEKATQCLSDALGHKLPPDLVKQYPYCPTSQAFICAAHKYNGMKPSPPDFLDPAMLTCEAQLPCSWIDLGPG